MTVRKPGGIDDTEGAMTFEELRALARARGFYEPATGRVLLELGAHATLAVAGFLLALGAATVPIALAGLCLSTLGSLGVATNCHTSSHHGSSRHRWLNDALTWFGYPLFLQVSATSWRDRHVRVHHPHPNVVGRDDDIALAPWFAFTRAELEGSRGARAWLYRHQGWLFPVMLAGNGFSTQLTSWRFLLSRLRDPSRREVKHWADLAVMLLHWAVWYGAPMLFLPPWKVAILNLARIVMMGYAMFAAFAPAHWPDEAMAVGAADMPTDPYLLQTSNTINFRAGTIGTILCSGVDYQIEHHLFPGICHVHYPALSILVRTFCQRNGYPYRTLGWGEALRKSFGVMWRPKDMARDLRPEVWGKVVS